MNYADSEKMKKILLNAGYYQAETVDDADVVVLNTCSVRQRAEDKVLGLGRQMAALKEKNPEVAIILTGCMAQRFVREDCEDVYDGKYERRLMESMPWVDHVVKIGDLASFARIIGDDASESYFAAKQAYDSSVTAYVPISTGCDNFCTYCIVPYTRGSEVHREFSEIREQVKNLVGDGYRLITLLGQNVNSWEGKIGGERAKFHDLLGELAQVSGDYWITFLTSHPKDFTEDLVQVMAEKKRVCPYLNLPVQSGSDVILQKMNRKYTRDEYASKIEMVKKSVPNIRLSTDIIVGFPGETDKDFEQTMQLLKEIQFDMVYVSPYSPRKPAVSSLTEDGVPKEIKDERRRCVEDLIRNHTQRENRKMVGRAVDVLVTEKGKGQTHDLRDVLISDGDKQVGSFVEVSIEDSSPGGLVGRVIV